MLNQIPTEHILFLDLETVPQYADYLSAPEREQELWAKKSAILKKNEEDSPATLYPRAGIYAEFGKIICIGIGMIIREGNQLKAHVSHYAGEEKKVLSSFAELLNKNTHRFKWLCAHNGKEFDFPYLCRRMLINGIKLPSLLQLAGKKPWEVNFIDTMELWKFGDFKNYTSLDLLAHVFGIPTPKDDLDGSMVADVYYREKNLSRITAYCEKDVFTLMQLYIKFAAEPELSRELAGAH